MQDRMMCSQNLQRPFLWAAGFDEIISEHVSERFWVRDLFSWCTYGCTYVAVTLMNVAGFWLVGFWHAGSGYLLGFHLPQGWCEIFNFEDRWTSILCLQELAVSTRHLYTAAPFTADKKKVGRAWNEATVWMSGVARAWYARAATCGVEQWVLVTHSNPYYVYTCKHVVKPHLRMQHTRHGADTYYAAQVFYIPGV